MRGRLSYRILLPAAALWVLGPPAPAQQKQDPPKAPAKPDTPKPDAPKPAGPPAPATTTPAPAAPAPSAEDLNRKAEMLTREGKAADAIVIFKQVLAANPKDIQAYIGLGDAYLNSKHFDEAAQAYQSAIKLNPTFDYYVFLGVAYVDGKRFDDAARAYQSAIDLRPNSDNRDLYLGLGSALMLGEKYTEARRVFERTTELYPNDLRARLAVGESYVREKDYVNARAAYINALGFAPDNPDVHKALGDVYEQESLHQAALDEFDAALRVVPGDIAAIMGRSTALSGLKRYDESEKIMRGLVAQLPKESAAHSGLAQVLDSANKHEEAIAEYKTAIGITPDDPVLWGNLGWSQYGAGQYVAAVESGRKALQIDPKLAYVRFNIGLVFAVQDRWPNAQKEYADAVAVAGSTDIHAAISDVRDAMAKMPNVSALKQALDYLTTAERKALIPTDLTD